MPSALADVERSACRVAGGYGLATDLPQLTQPSQGVRSYPIRWPQRRGPRHGGGSTSPPSILEADSSKSVAALGGDVERRRSMLEPPSPCSTRRGLALPPATNVTKYQARRSPRAQAGGPCSGQKRHVLNSRTIRSEEAIARDAAEDDRRRTARPGHRPRDSLEHLNLRRSSFRFDETFPGTPYDPASASLPTWPRGRQATIIIATSQPTFFVCYLAGSPQQPVVEGKADAGIFYISPSTRRHPGPASRRPSSSSCGTSDQPARRSSTSGRRREQRLRAGSWPGCRRNAPRRRR